MLAKRIIPCLDVKAGRVVKGVQFVGLRDAGDPVDCARRYDAEGADEVTFLDITASHDARSIFLDVVERTADCLAVPLTVGGGVRRREDVRDLLLAGADKVSINTAALSDLDLVPAVAAAYGSQAIVVAIDAKRVSDDGDPPRFEVFTHGGRRPTGRSAIAWAQQVAEMGAGEILLTSMNRDGTHSGYDLTLTRAVVDAVPIPVVASGGAGSPEDIRAGLVEGGANAALAASIFHDRVHSIAAVKGYLAAHGVHVRPVQEAGAPRGAEDDPGGRARGGALSADGTGTGGVGG